MRGPFRQIVNCTLGEINEVICIRELLLSMRSWKFENCSLLTLMEIVVWGKLDLGVLGGGGKLVDELRSCLYVSTRTKNNVIYSRKST